jgi:hypothetical protein
MIIRRLFLMIGRTNMYPTDLGAMDITTKKEQKVCANIGGGE